MKLNWSVFAAVALLVCVSSVSAQQAAKRPKRKPNAALKQIEDQAGLPRVLLIGDSISIGYTLATRKLLENKANVHRIPVNGGDTKRGLASLDQWLGEKKWDIIHFNWGLHDLKKMDGKTHSVAVAEYEANLRKIVAKLKDTGGELIWCSTTPVPDGDLKPVRLDTDVVAYNAVAKKIMDENGIATDDLYAFAKPRLAEIQRPANVHFSPEGSAALAAEVAVCIEKALAE